ncbi:hypothetical protein CYMTET_22740 [Cymbomonas tetramitiformis]|uniref:Uncharacterized protein n=1 Tax=Cymbomonas tetramitiformis TaxID=36881 RepID=A0AAE0L1Z2_9CHLO|nr:hypothetical protein CYMTET_22740 [Cymbomonas tetramitiformis]
MNKTTYSNKWRRTIKKVSALRRLAVWKTPEQSHKTVDVDSQVNLLDRYEGDGLDPALKERFREFMATKGSSVLETPEAAEKKEAEIRSERKSMRTLFKRASHVLRFGREPEPAPPEPAPPPASATPPAEALPNAGWEPESPTVAWSPRMARNSFSNLKQSVQQSAVVKNLVKSFGVMAARLSRSNVAETEFSEAPRRGMAQAVGSCAGATWGNAAGSGLPCRRHVGECRRQ